MPRLTRDYVQHEVVGYPPGEEELVRILVFCQSNYVLAMKAADYLTDKGWGSVQVVDVFLSEDDNESRGDNE